MDPRPRLALRLLLLLGLGIAGAALARPVHAQDDDAKHEAAALVDEGNDHYRAHRYQEAVEAFEAAYRTLPSAKILMSLAQAENAAGRPDKAAAHYEQILRDEPFEGEALRNTAKNRLDTLTRSLGRVVFEDASPGTRYRMDDAPAAIVSDLPLWVEPGHHSFSFEHDGDEPMSLDVQVGVGKKVVIKAALKSLVEPPPPQLVATPPPPAAAEESGSIAGKWWFWAGAAVLIGGTIALAVAASTGGSDFVPNGELGRFQTTDWDPIEMQR